MTPLRFCRASLLSLIAVSAPTVAQNSQVIHPTLAKVSQAALQGNLTHEVEPVYPPGARDAGVSGNVVLRALIGVDGTTRSLEIVSGPRLLLQPALDAVKQWTYRPWRLNDQPVEVEAIITVPFSLQQSVTAAQPDFTAFTGGWRSVDPDTRGITRIQIAPNPDGSFQVHAWGKCHPTDCDWGTTIAEHPDHILQAIWKTPPIPEKHLELLLVNDGRLRAYTETRFSNGGFSHQVYEFVPDMVQ